MMDLQSLIHPQLPTSPMSSLHTNPSTREEDRDNKPSIPSQASNPSQAPARTKSQNKSKVKLTPSKKPPKKAKARSSIPTQPNIHPWTTADKLVLLDIVS